MNWWNLHVTAGRLFNYNSNCRSRKLGLNALLKAIFIQNIYVYQKALIPTFNTSIYRFRLRSGIANARLKISTPHTMDDYLNLYKY